MLRRLRRMHRKSRPRLEGYLLQRYPDFVLSDRVDLHGPNAFAFHDVTERTIRPVLEYLVDNGYRTINADEFVDRRALGGGDPNEVLLTFDDGYRSLYTELQPLLEEYDLSAVAYIVPGLVEVDVSDDSYGYPSLCSWQELRELHATGRVDIQCHSLLHHTISVSARVVDFVRPRVDLALHSSDVRPIVRQDGQRLPPELVPLGVPIHPAAPRFAGKPAYVEHPGVIERTTTLVAEGGREGFFANPGSRRRLKREVARARREGLWGRWETVDDCRGALVQDLTTARLMIEREVPGTRVEHFCYPWYVGSALAMEACAEAGYRSQAFGSILPRYARHPSPGCLPFPRLPDRFVWRLPGDRRKSLLQVLRMPGGLLARPGARAAVH